MIWKHLHKLQVLFHLFLSVRKGGTVASWLLPHAWSMHKKPTCDGQSRYIKVIELHFDDFHRGCSVAKAVLARASLSLMSASLHLAYETLRWGRWMLQCLLTHCHQQWLGCFFSQFRGMVLVFPRLMLYLCCEGWMSSPGYMSLCLLARVWYHPHSPGLLGQWWDSNASFSFVKHFSHDPVN